MNTGVYMSMKERRALIEALLFWRLCWHRKLTDTQYDQMFERHKEISDAL
jgi:hypothetical protein